MNLKIIKDTNELYEIEEEWKKLQSENNEITFYSTIEFIKEWWNINESDASLFVIIVTEGNKVLGVAPLCIETRKKFFLKYRVLKFLGRGDFFNFILQEKNNLTIAKKIFEEIEKNHEKWDKIELTHIEEEASLLWYLNRSQKYKSSIRYLEECPYVDINNIEKMECYSRKYGPSKINWYRNKLEKEVGYNLEVICDGGEKTVNIIADIHKMEQKYLRENKLRDERESLYEDKKKAELVKRMYEKKGLSYTFLLKANTGEIMSYSTCYFYNNIMHLWNTGYIPKFNKYSVSKLSYYEIIKYCFENNICKQLDLGAGGYPWKFEWTNKSRKLYSFELWNSNNYIYKIKKLRGKF